jgi:hypothetical protein
MADRHCLSTSSKREVPHNIDKSSNLAQSRRYLRNASGPYTVLPAALNAVLVSSHGLTVLLSAMTCLYSDEPCWTALQQATRIRGLEGLALPQIFKKDHQLFRRRSHQPTPEFCTDRPTPSWTVPHIRHRPSSCLRSWKSWY